MRIYSQTSVNVEGDRSYGGGHVIVSMSPTETPVVEKVGDLVHIRAKGGLADHLTLTFRPDDATRSVLRRVLEAMGTELVSKDHTPTPTPPVCDHCGEPVEPRELRGLVQWVHTDSESVYTPDWCEQVTGPFTVATVNGSKLYPADLAPDPSLSTPPVCDHCGEPVEAQRLGMTWEWAHSGERDEEGTLFYPCANDPQMIAQVDGFRTVPRGE